MADESSDYLHGRRTFLKSIGAIGASIAIVPNAAAQEDPETLDKYHTTLRNQLTASSRQQKQLPRGEYVYGTTEQATLDAFTLQGRGSESTIAVDTDAVSITTGERIKVPGGSTTPRDVTYKGLIEDHSFSTDDLLLGVAWVRSDSEDARVTATFKYRYTRRDGATGTTDSFVQRGADIDPSGKWMRYFFPIEVGEKPAGSDHTPFLEFYTGYGEQTIDFGGIALFDYSDSDISLGALPPYDYAGRAENAAWREAAQQRIETHRKTDIEIKVLNPGGRPIPLAEIDIEMLEHSFDFGSAVSVDHLTGDSTDDETYRETFLENFNKAVVENGMKHPAWEGDWDIDNDATRATLDWLNERNIPTRGHYLLWEEFGTGGGGGMSIENPEQKSATEISDSITEKITSHAERFEDDVVDWDMHNHPIWQPNFRDDDGDGLGWADLRRWWDAAASTTAHDLYTNEMGIVGGSWQRSQYLEFVSRIVGAGYPLGGIAFMGHHQQQWNQLLDVEDMLAGFEAFSHFGVPILVSEFDIQIFSRRNAQDVAVQADYTRDFLIAAFSMPAVEGVLSWGFWAGDHWRPTGAYYEEDWTLRPNGAAYQDLVFHEWWTEESGLTDHDGGYSTRGFKGQYRISAEKGALSGETTVTVDDGSGTVIVELTPPRKDDHDSPL